MNRHCDSGYDVLTWAQREGENPLGTVFVPGADFDPWDQEEVELVEAASAFHRRDRLAQLEEENAILRARLAVLEDE